MRRSGLIVLGLLLWPVLARAERALVLPLRSEIALTPEVRTEAQEALIAALAKEDIDVAVDSSTEPCPDAACVGARVVAAGATHALELKLWRAADGAVSGVSVSVVEPSGARFSDGAQVAAEGGLSAAIARATGSAFERLRRGPGPWLEVTGSPEGAAISVDGQAAGALPRRVKVSGGLHRVAISSPGYETLEQTVTVARNPDALKHLEVALRSAARADDESVRASPWNYAIAGAAIAAGIVLGIGPVQSAARDGECGRRESGVCTGVVAFDGGEGVQLAAAGLLVGAGVGFAIWSPITLRVDENGPVATLHGHF